MNIKLLLTTTLIAGTIGTQAQSARNTAYAITGDGNKDYLWMNIRQVDLSTGEVVKTLFERSKSEFSLTDVQSKKSVDQTSIGTSTNIFADKVYPTATFVAASALDRKNNRLYFAPMRLNELRWLDLGSKSGKSQFYSLSSPVLQFGDVNDEANHLTRMVIAADGNGYAMTNDGNHLIKFTTGKNPVITDLGNVIDAEGSTYSIHNKCSSWGGDMLADAFGKLYVVSANMHVFVIDINSRVATYKGHITGTPAAYTANAAAVDTDGDIIITSANFFEGYYKVKFSDLSATKMMGSDAKYNASDLAGSNLLLEKEAAQASKFTIVTPDVKAQASNAKSLIFPNPVTSNTFKVMFDGQPEGRYTIVFSDLQGRAIQSKSVTINKASQFESVNIMNRPAKGVYMVKVMNAQNQIVATEKIVLE